MEPDRPNTAAEGQGTQSGDSRVSFSRRRTLRSAAKSVVLSQRFALGALELGEKAHYRLRFHRLSRSIVLAESVAATASTAATARKQAEEAAAALRRAEAAEEEKAIQAVDRVFSHSVQTSGEGRACAVKRLPIIHSQGAVETSRKVPWKKIVVSWIAAICCASWWVRALGARAQQPGISRTG
eukprot:SAG31_NODE_222_length_19895_cov_34.907626_13_plen_183_part_00